MDIIKTVSAETLAHAIVTHLQNEDLETLIKGLQLLDQDLQNLQANVSSDIQDIQSKIQGLQTQVSQLQDSVTGNIAPMVESALANFLKNAIQKNVLGAMYVTTPDGKTYAVSDIIEAVLLADNVIPGETKIDFANGKVYMTSVVANRTYVIPMDLTVQDITDNTGKVIGQLWKATTKDWRGMAAEAEIEIAFNVTPVIRNLTIKRPELKRVKNIWLTFNVQETTLPTAKDLVPDINKDNVIGYPQQNQNQSNQTGEQGGQTGQGA